MLTALLSYWIMIGSQALTRHVLFTCVLFHLLSIAAFRFFFLACIRSQESFWRSGTDEEVKGRPIEQFYKTWSAKRKPRFSPQNHKISVFDFFFLSDWKRLLIQMSIKRWPFCGIPHKVTKFPLATLWNRLELMINTVEKDGVDLDPVRTRLDI